MARNRRGDPVQNWDDEPTTIEKLPGIKPGDLVQPKFPMQTSQTQYEDIYIAAHAREGAIIELTTADGSPTVNGIKQGIYIGQKRLAAPRSVKTGTHWSSTRKVIGLALMFHIFMFGNHRIIIPLDDVETISEIKIPPSKVT